MQCIQTMIKETRRQDVVGESRDFIDWARDLVLENRSNYTYQR